MRPPVLLLPGWTNSGPLHWQSLWQKANPAWNRVEQDDWLNTEPGPWVGSLRRAVAAAEAPPILVGHSLGALTIARWAAEHPDERVAGALLVAPPDVERADTPEALRSFRPMPRERMAFPSLLVASRTDPFLAWERALTFADAWGSNLRDAGDGGHLNTEAGLGTWPDDLRWLDELVSMRDTRGDEPVSLLDGR